MKTLSDCQNIHDLIKLCAAQYGEHIGLSYFREGHWELISYRQILQRSSAIAGELQRAGVQKGTPVALLGESSPDWILHFLAVQLCGGIAVPLDIQLKSDEFMHILGHANPTVLLSSRHLLETARSVRLSLHRPPKVLVMEDSTDDTATFNPVEVATNDVALICYTSGTAGAPKGVEVMTRTLLFQAEGLQTISEKSIGEREVLLSILPFNHLYGLNGGVLYALASGIEFCIAYELTPESIGRCLRQRHVTQILAVPLYVKLVMQGILGKVTQKKPLSRALFAFLMILGRAIPIRWVRQRLFIAIHRALGGKLRRFICGGAVLEPAVHDFFQTIGIPVYVGYGLTETGPVISVNTPASQKRSSVGRPIPGIEVRIVKEKGQDELGEIQTRGPHIMRGYHRNPTLTAECVDPQGWFATGDLGYIDEEGHLYVQGRRKALIVLASGKKVHPEEVEAVIGRSPWVQAVCVVGLRAGGMLDERVTAVVQPTELFGQRPLAEMEAEITRLCAGLAPYKAPQKVLMRTTPFPMTTSLKIKRNLLLEELRAQT